MSNNLRDWCEHNLRKLMGMDTQEAVTLARNELRNMHITPDVLGKAFMCALMSKPRVVAKVQDEPSKQRVREEGQNGVQAAHMRSVCKRGRRMIVRANRGRKEEVV